MWQRGPRGPVGRADAALLGAACAHDDVWEWVVPHWRAIVVEVLPEDLWVVGE